MSTIDWERFAARVPAGTVILYQKRYEGILIENYPWRAVEDHLELEFSAGKEMVFKHPRNWLRFEPFDKENRGPLSEAYEEYAPHLIYLIDGQWLTFDEVMT